MQGVGEDSGKKRCWLRYLILDFIHKKRTENHCNPHLRKQAQLMTKQYH